MCWQSPTGVHKDFLGRLQSAQARGYDKAYAASRHFPISHFLFYNYGLRSLYGEDTAELMYPATSSPLKHPGEAFVNHKPLGMKSDLLSSQQSLDGCLTTLQHSVELHMTLKQHLAQQLDPAVMENLIQLQAVTAQSQFMKRLQAKRGIFPHDPKTLDSSSSSPCQSSPSTDRSLSSPVSHPSRNSTICQKSSFKDIDPVNCAGMSKAPLGSASSPVRSSDTKAIRTYAYPNRQSISCPRPKEQIDCTWLQAGHDSNSSSAKKTKSSIEGKCIQHTRERSPRRSPVHLEQLTLTRQPQHPELMEVKGYGPGPSVTFTFPALCPYLGYNCRNDHSRGPHSFRDCIMNQATASLSLSSLSSSSSMVDDCKQTRGSHPKLRAPPFVKA